MNKNLAIILEYARQSSDARVREAALRLEPRKRTEEERASARAKEKKRQGRREKVAAIRERVMARAGGRCEAYAPTLGASETPRGNRCTGVPIAMDHWLGGNGRRRALESVETCWALCSWCNHLRTHNEPGTAYWNLSFEIHCNAHGYPFTPHYDARAAQKATR